MNPEVVTKIKAALIAKKQDSSQFYLPCREAFSIAEEFGVTVAEIGKFCNEQNIKICSCQLGCF